MEQEFGGRLPEDVEVRVAEESADTIYLVLPSASPLGEGVELSDQELEAVAGGAWTGLTVYIKRTCEFLHKNPIIPPASIMTPWRDIPTGRGLR